MKKHNQEKKPRNEEILIDFAAITNTTKKVIKTTQKLFEHKHSKIILTWVLIAIVILISTWYRTYPVNLPVTQDWIRDSIETNVKNQLAIQQTAQNPSLPESTINSIVNEQYKQYYAQNKASIEEQVKIQSENYKAQMQNENGQTYLLAIDPYLWYSYAKWYERTGFFGNEVVDGKEKFTLVNGRIGKDSTFVWPSAVIVGVHKIISIFKPTQDILATAFILPAILIGLAAIPAFFLGRKLGGLPGGFFAATLFVLSPSILGRTTAGFSDTDAYTFIFPFLTVWLFLESIETKSTNKKVLLSSLTALSAVLFGVFWGGAWFTLNLILGLTVIFIVYKIGVYTFKNKKFNVNKQIKNVKPELIFLGMFIVGVIVIGAIIALATGGSVDAGFNSLIRAPIEPLNFILGFKGAAEGITATQGLNYPLWPNVLTTVAELNEGNSAQVIAGGGGPWVVGLAILGIIFLLFKQKNGESYPLYGLLLAVWLASTYYAGLVGIRFIALFSPVVAFGIAGLIGALTGERMKKLSENVSIPFNAVKYTVIILAIALLLAPQMTIANNIAKNELPTYSDTWDRAMKTIKSSSDKAIISSWWDFGHWFEAMSERSVTFDGGDQGKRIHWIGKSLLTDNETEALNLLKMLNCGQEEGYKALETNLKDKYDATKTLHEIIALEKEDAIKFLENKGLNSEQINEIIRYTHCEDYIDMYYIASSDMIGKAGVWGHFGSWDFDRAYVYYRLKNLPLQTAILEGKEKLGLDEEELKAIYLDAQKITTENQANTWISPWPNYAISNPPACQEAPNSSEIILCDINVAIANQNGIVTQLSRAVINLSALDTSAIAVQSISQQTGVVQAQNLIRPRALVIQENNTLKEHVFKDGGMQLDLTLYTDADGTKRILLSDPLLSKSMFTRLFYMGGQTTEHFEEIFDETDFRGVRIRVFKVNP